MTPLSKRARVAGLLYIVASAVAFVRLLYIPQVLFVHGNATATARNIVAHETLFRWGIVTYLVGGVLFIFVTLALYQLLKSVDRGLAVVMVILGGLMQTPTYVVNTAMDAAALLLARGGEFLAVIDTPRRDALAMLFLELHFHLDVASEIFSGLWLLPLGLLIYRSGFLPRLIGVWVMLACFAWLAVCFTDLLFPGHEDAVFNFAQPFTFGELVTMLWLAIVGAKERPRPATA